MAGTAQVAARSSRRESASSSSERWRARSLANCSACLSPDWPRKCAGVAFRASLAPSRRSSSRLRRHTHRSSPRSRSRTTRFLRGRHHYSSCPRSRRIGFTTSTRNSAVSPITSRGKRDAGARRTYRLQRAHRNARRTGPLHGGSLGSRRDLLSRHRTEDGPSL